MVFICSLISIVIIMIVTIIITKDELKSNKSDILSSVVTQNKYPEIGKVSEWLVEQNIKADYKGSLQ